MTLLELFLRSVFVENLALTFFLGICTLLGGSRWDFRPCWDAWGLL